MYALQYSAYIVHRKSTPLACAVLACYAHMLGAGAQHSQPGQILSKEPSRKKYGKRKKKNALSI